MRVAIFTSVNWSNPVVSQYAALTTPNKLDYCRRRGYSLVVDDAPYDLVGIAKLLPLFEMYDVVWTLDADALITNMSIDIVSLPSIGRHVTACEEGIVPWNKINCGSVVWKNTRETRYLIKEIACHKHVWERLPCGWQTWIADIEIVTTAPLRSFNSCEWTHPGGGEEDPGSHWQDGDFVYHPCGVYPLDRRVDLIRDKLKDVVT